MANLDVVDSKAVLRPLLVIPRPQIQFEDQKVNWVHIVILIQTSCGEAFIFDSTGEQHGVWKYHRFSTWNFYRYYYVMPQEYWSTGVTFACDDNFEGLRQQTLEESKLWADYMTLVDAVADEWFHTPGEVDLLERMKDHLGRDWARPPYDIPLEERAVRESTWIERAKPRGDTWIA